MLIFFSILLLFSPASAASPWKFHADLNNTGVYDDGGVHPDNLQRWSSIIGSPVLSGASADNGTVYFGTMAGLYALNESTGSAVWSAPFGSFYTTPAVKYGNVYAGTTGGFFFCLNQTTGAVNWSVSRAEFGGSSPAVDDGVVYVGDGILFAFNAFTGTELWNYPTGGAVRSSPALAGGTLYFGSDDGKVYAVNATSGLQLWNITTGGAVLSSPAAAGGIIYIGSSDNNVTALNAVTGAKIWNFTTGDDVESSPAVSGGIVYVGSNDRRIYALDAGTGALHWSYLTGDAVRSSPAVANGIVYAGSDDGKVYAIDAATGVLRWTFSTGAWVRGSPAVADGMVLVGNYNNRFYAIGSGTIAPVADFTAVPLSGTAPLPISFTDLSLNNPTGWAWFFGDENFTQPWTQVNASAGWPARRAHTSVALPDGSIILMGGLDNGGSIYYKDVWRSIDNGATWTSMNVSGNPGWGARYGHTSVVLPDGSIVLMGGYDFDFGNYQNDVWRSADNGATWTQVNASAGWSARAWHSSVAMPDGSIVLTGGLDSVGSKKSDVWRSRDNGVTWTRQTSAATWNGRYSHSSVAMPDGSIILMGGLDTSGGNDNEVWRSTDNGVTWTQVNASAGWTMRRGHTSVVMPDSSIVLMGGIDSSRTNDTWRSADNGATWTNITVSLGWTKRYTHSSVVLPDGSIVLMGGEDSSASRQDVWRFMPAGSSAQNPSHTYTAAGIYNVTLQAYNSGGYNSTRKTGYITVTPGLTTGPVHNLNSGLNYTTIQAAITAASDADVILVDSGSYHEQVNITKTLTVRGQDTGSGDPVIDALRSGSPVQLSAPGITLANFTVTNSTDLPGAGIAVKTDNTTITNITTRDNGGAGIFVNGGSNSTLSGVYSFNNSRCGFYLWQAHNNTILDSTAYRNHANGVSIEDGDRNRILNSTQQENVRNGIYLISANSSIVSGNTLRDNLFRGINVSASGSGIISNNYLNNTQNAEFSGIVLSSTWNTTKIAGTNIIGGPFLAGNYWAQPNGQGFSQITPDTDGDGISNAIYTLGAGNIDHLPLTNNLSAPAPVASFIINVTSGTAPVTVQFTDTSSGSPTTWNWSFGDGGTSTLQNPLHTYTQYGSYSVVLNITNSSGQGSLTKRGAITVNGLPGWKFHGDGQNTGVYDDGGTRPNGVERWEYATGSFIDSSSPAISNATLYFQNHAGTLYALNASTGSLLWSYATGITGGKTGPAVADGTVYFGTGEGTDGYFYALDANTGALQWSVHKYDYSPSPAVANGLVITASSASNTFYAYNLSTHSQAWSVYQNAILHVQSSPAVGNGMVFAAFGNKMKSFDITDGSILWSYSSSGTVCNNPAFSNNTVYFACQGADTSLHALFADNGTEAWSTDLSTQIRTVPAVAGDVVYVGADRKLVALGAGNGTILWTNSTAISAEVYYSPALANGVVYVPCVDHKIYAFNATTGIKTWDFTTGGVLYSTPAVANGVVYIGSYDGKMYAIGTANLPPIANFTANVTSGFAPLAVQFTDSSTNTPASWNWSFGDGNTSAVQNPVHIYTFPGTFTVSLNASNAGGSNVSTRSNYISVTVPKPIPDFSANVTSGTAPLPVSFTDLSLNNPTGWAWFFGDEGYAEPWTEMNAHAAWTPRSRHTSVAMPDGSIVLMGGYNSSGNKNDVWRSTDEGATWTLMNASAGWNARYYHTSVAMPDGSIVLMGGYNGGRKNDVWRSADNGATWALMNVSAGWTPRFDHSSVGMPDGSIVLMGGDAGGSYRNDTWRSTDKGATWTLMNASAGWTGRYEHSSVALPDGSIVVMGGYDGTDLRNDVWRSTDNGATWTLVNASAMWSARDRPVTISMPDGSIVLVGGHDGSTPLNDVWRSTDNGATWTEVNASAGWPIRTDDRAVVLQDGSIVLTGGYNPPAYKDDVWKFAPAGSSLQNPSHTYTAPGVYNVSLQAYNPGGYKSTRKTSYITVMPGLTTGPVHNLNSGQNYTTIPAAIANATAGDMILVDSGTYTELVDANKRLALIGNNTGSGLPVVDIGSQGTNTAIALSADNVTLDGFIVMNSRDGVHITGANATVRNITATQNNFGISLDSTQGTRITNATIYNNTYDGIAVTSSTNTSVETCHIYENGGTGIIVMDWSQNASIGHNTVERNMDYGIFLQQSFNNTVSDNTLKTNYKGIVLEIADINTLERNNVSNSTWEGIRLDKAIGNTFDNNNVADNHDNGIAFLNASDGNVVTGNHVLRNSEKGLYLESSANNTFTNNQFSLNNYGVLLTESRNNTFISTLADRNQVGVELNSNSSSNTVNNLEAFLNAQAGIYIDSFSRDTLITSSAISGSGTGVSVGFASNGTHFTLNVVENTTSEGLWLGDVTGCVVAGNTFRHGETGMHLSGTSSSSFTNNTASDNTDYGILIQGNSFWNTFSANNASANGIAGVNFDTSSHSIFADNRMDANGYGALLSNDVNITFTGNMLSTSWEPAFDLVACRNITLSDNDIQGTGIWGTGAVRLSESENTSVLNNRIRNNYDFGIYLKDNSSSNLLSGNNITGHTDAGISAEYSFANVFWANTISENLHGIKLDSVYGSTVSGNVISNNTYGIKVVNSTGNAVYNNTFANTQNAQDDGTNLWNITKQAGTTIHGGSWLGGNNWSDYTGADTDGDGIGNTFIPYNNGIITGGDWLPLTNATSLLNQPPVASNVILTSTSGLNLTSDNLTLRWDVHDADGDPVRNITTWYRNGIPLTSLILPFEGGSNSTFTGDYSGSANNGLVNGPAWNSSGGHDGSGAYEFDGINDYIEGSNAGTNFPTGSSPRTITAWIRSHDAAGVQRIILHYGTDAWAPTNFHLLLDGSGEVILGNGNGFGVILSTVPVDDETWHFIAGVYEGPATNLLRIYIDGNENRNGTASTIPNTGTGNNWQVGRSLPGDYHFTGTIDEIQIYNKALSAEQIHALYLNQKELIVRQDLSEGETWQGSITPNDGTTDGSTVLSNSLNIVSLTPVADFTATITSGPAPLAVQFYDTSTGSPTSWNWSFGDGSFSMLQNPMHAYDRPGIYTVSLNVTNATGFNLRTKTDYIWVDFASVSMFRGDRQHTGVYDTGGTAPTNNLNWSFTTGNTIYSSPAVAGDTVYFGSDDKKMYAVYTANGTQKWNFTTGHIVDFSSAAVADGVVYFGSHDGHVYAVYANNGTQKWNFTAGNWVRSSPAVSDGIVYIGCDNKNLYAIHADNGTRKWNFTTGDLIRSSSPAVADGVVYIGSNDYKLHAVYASNGTEKWNFTTGAWVMSSPAVSDGMVYFGSEDHKLYAVYASNGTEKWNFTTENEIDSSPAIANGAVYIGSLDGSLYAVNASTGGKLWNFTPNNYGIYSSPAIANGVVYIGSLDFNFYAVNATTGGKIWNFTTGSEIWSSPVVANGFVYFGSVDGKLYALGGTSAPLANFTANVTSGISPLTVNFTDLSTNSPTSWNWSFGDGNVSSLQNPVHTYAFAGNFSVNLSVANAGGSDFLLRTGYINVSAALPPAPVAGFTANVTSGTAPVPVLFTDTSTGSPASWNWSFGDGNVSTVQNPVHVYSFNGTFTVSLNASNAGGSNTTTLLNYITVTAPNTLPVVSNVVLSSTSGFNRTSDNLTLTWDTFDANGDPVRNITTWKVNSSSIMALNMPFEGGSSSSFSRDYSGYNNNITSAFGTPVWEQTGGHDNSGAYNFYGNSYLIIPDSPSLDVTNAITLESWVYPTQFAGSYRVILSKWIGGSKSYYLGCQATGICCISVTHDANTDDALCTSSALSLSTWSHLVGTYDSTNGNMKIYLNGVLSNSKTTSGSIWSGNAPLWIGSNTGAPTQRFIGKIDLARIYSTALTAEQIRVLSQDHIEAIVHQETDIGESWQACITPNDGFADGSVVCSNTLAIRPDSPVANFTANVTSGISPLTVNFTDLSTNSPTSWNWSFGDGNVSSLQNPVHTYAFAGNFSVNLSVANAGGSDFLLRTGYVNVSSALPLPPVADFFGSPPAGTAPLTVMFTDTSANFPTSWNWSFGDGNISTLQNPSYTYTLPGAYTVNLTVSNAFGNDTLSRPNYITVTPSSSAPAADFSANATVGCAPMTVRFTDLSSNSPTAWEWDFGDGDTSALQDPVHTYGTGIHTVSLKAANAAGSTRKVRSEYITVYAGCYDLSFTIPGLTASGSPQTVNLNMSSFNGSIDVNGNIVNATLNPGSDFRQILFYLDPITVDGGDVTGTPAWVQFQSRTLDTTFPSFATERPFFEANLSKVPIPTDAIGISLIKNMNSAERTKFQNAAAQQGMTLGDTGYLIHIQTTIPATDMNGVHMTMDVPAAWAAGFGNSYVKILRIDGSGTTTILDTSFIGYAGSDARFRAHSPDGFSTYGISGLTATPQPMPPGGGESDTSGDIAAPAPEIQEQPVVQQQQIDQPQQPQQPEQPQVIGLLPGTPELLEIPAGQEQGTVVAESYPIGFEGLSFNADNQNTLSLAMGAAENAGAVVTQYFDRIEIYQHSSPGVTLTFYGDNFQYINGKITGPVKRADFRTDPLLASTGSGTVSGSVRAVLTHLTGSYDVNITIRDKAPTRLSDIMRSTLISEGRELDRVAYVMNIDRGVSDTSGAANITLTIPQAWVNTHGGMDRIRIVRVTSDGTFSEALPSEYKGRDPTGAFIFEAYSPHGTSVFGLLTVKAQETKATLEPTRAQPAPPQKTAVTTVTGMFWWIGQLLMNNFLIAIPLAFVLIAFVIYAWREKRSY